MLGKVCFLLARTDELLEKYEVDEDEEFDRWQSEEDVEVWRALELWLREGTDQPKSRTNAPNV